MTRCSSTPSSIKTCETFQMLHIDIWGPMKTPIKKNCNSFIIIVDDFFKFT